MINSKHIKPQTDSEVWSESFPDDRIKQLFEIKPGPTTTEKPVHRASKQSVNVDLKEMENTLKNTNMSLEKQLMHIKMILKRYEERLLTLENNINELEGVVREIKRK